MSNKERFWAAVRLPPSIDRNPSTSSGTQSTPVGLLMKKYLCSVYYSLYNILVYDTRLLIKNILSFLSIVSISLNL